MSFFDSSLLDDDDDEEDIEEERKAALKKNMEREAFNANKRSQARQREEERRFPKIYKIEKLKLVEYLQQEKVTLADDLKMKYLSECGNAAKFFEGEDGELVEELRQIKTKNDLKKFIHKRYERIWSEHLNREHDKLHQWLVEFHLQTVKALERTTQLPSGDHLYSSTAENIFIDLQEDMKSHADKKKFREWREQEKIREAEEVQKMMNTATTVLDEMNLCGEGTSRAAREIARLSVDHARHPHEDSSPDRRRVSLEAEMELVDFFKDFYVKDDQPEPEQVQKKNTGNGIGFFGIPDDDDEEAEEDDYTRNPLLPPKTVWPGSKWTYIEKKSDSEEEEEDESVVPVATWREELGYEERVPSCFGRHASLENRQLSEKARFENKRKRNKNKLSFAAYDSPLNKMRIFIQPNNHFFASSDDGPTTDYTDMTLRDGTLYVHSLPAPFILEYNIATLNTRRKEGIRRRAQKLWLTLPSFPPCVTSLKHRGNLLGRFCFPRIPNLAYKSIKDKHQQERFALGLVLQYTLQELVSVYSRLSGKAHAAMGRRLHFVPYKADCQERKDKKKAKVAGVLLLTDWRLAFLNDDVLTNVVMHYLPTNMSGVFFDTMAECLIELILDANIEFHTIVFAFGGAPSFRKEDFLRFWKKLTVHTTKTYDVFWTAQDWCDGLKSTQEELDQLRDFNCYVENVFEAMNETGHRNYKFCDIRRQYQVTPMISEESTGEPDISKLQKLYDAYLSFFVNECNCYGHSAFFANEPEIDDYAMNDSRCPLLKSSSSRKKMVETNENNGEKMDVTQQFSDVI